jgi:hypothetical protein
MVASVINALCSAERDLLKGANVIRFPSNAYSSMLVQTVALPRFAKSHANRTTLSKEGLARSAELVSYHQNGNYFLELRDILSAKVCGKRIRPLKHVCGLPRPCGIGQMKMVWATLRTHRKTNLAEMR